MRNKKSVKTFNRASLQDNQTVATNSLNTLLEIPIAHKKLEKQLKEIGIPKAIKAIKESLVRLTKNYSGEKLEKIITGIIKEQIFVYVFCPEHQPLSTLSERCNAQWHALTSCQASVIFSHPELKVNLFHDFYFGVDDLWVSKTDSKRLLDINDSANTRLIKIAEKVTNEFWLRDIKNDDRKSVVIIDWLINNFAVSETEARAIDKICRPDDVKERKSKSRKK